MTDTLSEYFTEGEPIADTKAPDQPIDKMWTQHKFDNALVNPANRRKLDVIIVGTGLAGASAAATMGEAGYNVKSFFYQDSARRAPGSGVSERMWWWGERSGTDGVKR